MEIKSVHDGTWFITRHSALYAQTPGHGSVHLSLGEHALEGAQSEWVTHSGLQPV